MEIPVYVFVGFLDSGKTKFIQETMEDKRFNSGDKTLLLVCEEGEEEYDISKFSSQNVKIEVLEDISELTKENLACIEKKYSIKRVVVEYNGMWNLPDFYDNMPDNWAIYQEMTFFEQNTFNTYNTNMRSLVVDKLQDTELVVFNRCPKDIDKLPMHKVVRGISRSANIIYEETGGQIEYDEIEDPLPFDINAEIIEINEEDFAIWFRDLSEDMQKYVGKTVKFKGVVAIDKQFNKDTFAIGRHIMTCCVQDIAYKYLIAVGGRPSDLKTKDWYMVTAKISLEHHKAYRGKGPVLKVTNLEKAEKPEQEVATFY